MEEFAYQLAKKGLNIIIVRRNSSRLEVEIINFELSNDIDLFLDKISYFEIDHHINNAGFGWYGEFIKGDLNLYKDTISVNVDALTILSLFFSKRFVDKNKE